MSDKKPYYTGRDGKTRVKPAHKMIINGRVVTAGTIVKIVDTNEPKKEGE